jgi:hypothetical protein
MYNPVVCDGEEEVYLANKYRDEGGTGMAECKDVSN